MMRQAWCRSESGNPFAELQELVADVFDELMGRGPASEVRFPRTELRRTAEGYRLIAVVPGVKREDLEVRLEGRALCLEGERRPAPLPEGAQQVQRERWSGRFRKVVSLPEEVAADRVAARLRDGLLVVELPRPAGAGERGVHVQVEEER
jgi:HSP20 family protein